MFEVILIWLPIFILWPIAPYLLAKKKGKTVSRYLLLSLFLYPFVMVYLLLASDSSSGDLDLDYFDKLRGIHGVSDGLAREIMSHFPTAKKLARARVEKIMAIPGVGEQTANSIKMRFK